MQRASRALGCAGALGALYAGAAAAELQWNFQPAATQIAQDVSDLHLLMMGIIAVIFVGVFGVMFYSIYAHRRSVGHPAAQFHENTTVEVAWTIVPTLILVLMAWPATTHLLAVRDSSQPDITIKATGYQWKWGYDYIKGEGEGINFTATLSTPQDQIYGKAPRGEHYLLETDTHMVVPVGKKVRMLVTAADVLHAWYVPALAVKQDAIPGFIRDAAFRANREGVFRGQCAELCGKDHGFMPIVVEVVSQEKYTAWVAEQKKKLAVAAEDPSKKYDLAELRARGEKVYAANCVACHQANGKGVPNAFPALEGSKIVNGPLAEKLAIVVNGKAGTAMQAFGKQLSPTDIAAVVTYISNAWGNKSADNLVQPADVLAARK
jgi:cytochrome c oxidase subunit 2